MIQNLLHTGMVEPSLQIGTNNFRISARSKSLEGRSIQKDKLLGGGDRILIVNQKLFEGGGEPPNLPSQFRLA